MEELIKSKLSLKTGFSIEDEYLTCINDLISHELVKKMQQFKQHGNISCFEHCLYVSFVSYKICKFLGFNYKSASRGGLLHDFFLYDWHYEKPYKGLHGFIHPEIALKNADEHFELNKIERDIIKKHMWPMTVVLPKYKESYVVMIVDKVCASMEIVNLINNTSVSKLHVMVNTLYSDNL